ncbi:MAG TPA: NAD-dependent malic enzyme [Solirubrobacteraceae bacterium]|nr:NAD-dependent malic enzyme [Solirubrobacteraceae bacterium]
MSETPSAQYRIRITVEVDGADTVRAAADAIAAVGGLVQGAAGSGTQGGRELRDFTVDAASEAHWQLITDAVDAIEGARVLGTVDCTFEIHEGGKIEQRNKPELATRDDLSMAYTPGVARVCMAIAEDERLAYDYTIKRNTVAVVTDGSAVLGLGNIGPRAAMPVMEGKCCLFKEFADVDAFPVAIDSHDPDEIVQAVRLIAPGLGGINLEDIAAPRCFAIEAQLKRELEIPVFHDDQHGTAVVVLAALLNAAKLTGRTLESLGVLVIGVGAAGMAVTDILLACGVTNIIGCDSTGVLHTGRDDYADGTMNDAKRRYCERTNPERRSGRPVDAIEGLDLVVGLSGARVLDPDALARMNRDAMIFAMANPTPEVDPQEAARYARIIATGRSDYPNQINNVLCFPGIFRGALDARASEITDDMKFAAAQAIASIVPDAELRDDYIIPSVFNRAVAPAVAAAVVERARPVPTAQPDGTPA